MTPEAGRAFVRGHLYSRPEAMIGWAVNLVARGTDSRAVVILAGLTPTEGVWLIDEYFVAALAEQGEVPGSPVDEQLRYAADQAQALLDGTADGHSIARELAQLSRELGHRRELNEWSSVDDEYDLARLGVSSLASAERWAREAAARLCAVIPYHPT